MLLRCKIVHMNGDHVVLVFNIVVFTGGELGESRKWWMQIVMKMIHATLAVPQPPLLFFEGMFGIISV